MRIDKKLIICSIFFTLSAALIFNTEKAESRNFSFESRIVNAADQGNLAIVKALLNEGSSLNERGSFETTALHRAVFQNHKEIVDFLIQQGADIDLKDIGGATPLHIAARRGNIEMVKTLIRNGAKIDPEDNDGYTPLHRAVLNDRTALALFLSEAGANIDNQSKSGNTPLMDAIRNKNSFLVEELLISGANKSLKNKNKEDAIDYALRFEDKKINNLLSMKVGEIRRDKALNKSRVIVVKENQKQLPGFIDDDYANIIDGRPRSMASKKQISYSRSSSEIQERMKPVAINSVEVEDELIIDARKANARQNEGKYVSVRKVDRPATFEPSTVSGAGENENSISSVSSSINFPDAMASRTGLPEPIDDEDFIEVAPGITVPKIVLPGSEREKIIEAKIKAREAERSGNIATRSISRSIVTTSNSDEQTTEPVDGIEVSRVPGSINVKKFSGLRSSNEVERKEFEDASIPASMRKRSISSGSRRNNSYPISRKADASSYNKHSTDKDKMIRMGDIESLVDEKVRRIISEKEMGQYEEFNVAGREYKARKMPSNFSSRSLAEDMNSFYAPPGNSGYSHIKDLSKIVKSDNFAGSYLPKSMQNKAYGDFTSARNFGNRFNDSYSSQASSVTSKKLFSKSNDAFKPRSMRSSNIEDSYFNRSQSPQRATNNYRGRRISSSGIESSTNELLSWDGMTENELDRMLYGDDLPEIAENSVSNYQPATRRIFSSGPPTGMQPIYDEPKRPVARQAVQSGSFGSGGPDEFFLQPPNPGQQSDLIVFPKVPAAQVSVNSMQPTVNKQGFDSNLRRPPANNLRLAAINNQSNIMQASLAPVAPGQINQPDSLEGALAVIRSSNNVNSNSLIGTHALVGGFATQQDAQQFFNSISQTLGIVYNYKIAFSTNDNLYYLAIGALADAASGQNVCNIFKGSGKNCSVLSEQQLNSRQISGYNVVDSKNIYSLVGEFRSSSEARQYYMNKAGSRGPDYRIGKAGNIYLLQLGPFANGNEANSICNNYQSQNLRCKVAVQ
jgi:hypothetical protein